MIARVWSATATEQGAEGYAEHFTTSVLEELNELDGFVAAFLLRRRLGDETQIQVITHWDSYDKIRAFAGDDIGGAVVEPAAKHVLTTYETTVEHYEIVAAAGRPSSD
jgi:heme-degrading monooxygenase HmoA